MSTKQITRNAVFLALIIIAGLVAIPIPGVPVPIVLQNMIIMTTGFFLGKKNGFITVLAFLFFVFIGMPFLSGGRGGAAIFIGPSGGYLLGYLLSPVIVGFLLEKIQKVNFLLLAIIYFIGSALLIDILGGFSLAFAGNISILSGMKASATFLPVDILKVLIAAFVSARLHKYSYAGEKNAR